MTIPSPGHDEHGQFIAYRVFDGAFELSPAPPAREWMDEAPGRHPYRCLPMVMANQAGWFVRCTVAVHVRWTGGPEAAALEVETESDERPASSHFGHGLLTWHIPFLFRTPRGSNLLVRGPANQPLDGAYPLEGLVESDWSVATFTMNWKITRAGARITFPAQFPVAMLVPQGRGELERFEPSILPLAAAPELERGYHAWAASRKQFNHALADEHSAARAEKWQRHYFLGRSVDGTAAEQHQTRLPLRPFTPRE